MKLYGKIQFYNGGFITSWAFGEINGRKFIYVHDGWIHVFGGTYDMPEWEERSDIIDLMEETGWANIKFLGELPESEVRRVENYIRNGMEPEDIMAFYKL